MPVSIERKDSVATVIIDRPNVRNAVDGATAASLYEAFAALDADDDVAAVVLWGAGESFCSGADLHAFGTPEGNLLDAEGHGPMGPTRMEMSKPVIAAVEGFAVAGGFELALWCDLRVVAETAVFGVFCRRWGVPLVDGGTVRLPRIVGEGRALDLILTGREVHATEAKEMGLVTRMVPTGFARAEAEALARELATLPQTCLKNDRRSVLASSGVAHEAAMQFEFQQGLATLASHETAEGVRRFVAGAGRHGVWGPPTATSNREKRR